MFCMKCGAKIPDENAEFCPNCANKIKDTESGHINVTANNYVNVNANNDDCRFLPSFILGLVASVFGISGGLCVSMCSSLYSSGVAPFVLIFGGSTVGLIGACKCLKNAKKGSIMQLVAAVMIIICAYGITGSDFSTIIAMLLFCVSGIIGLIYSLSNSK